jgi:hypothetical protein
VTVLGLGQRDSSRTYAVASVANNPKQTEESASRQAPDREPVKARKEGDGVDSIISIKARSVRLRVAGCGLLSFRAQRSGVKKSLTVPGIEPTTQ